MHAWVLKVIRVLLKWESREHWRGARVRGMRWVLKPMTTLGPTWPLLFIESFYGGSHKQLVDLLAQEFGGDVYSLPASKWHWRSRVAALHFAHTLPLHHNYKLGMDLRAKLQYNTFIVVLGYMYTWRPALWLIIPRSIRVLC